MGQNLLRNARVAAGVHCVDLGKFVDTHGSLQRHTLGGTGPVLASEVPAKQTGGSTVKDVPFTTEVYTRFCDGYALDGGAVFVPKSRSLSHQQLPRSSLRWSKLGVVVG